jgi:hypothetical protein
VDALVIGFVVDPPREEVDDGSIGVEVSLTVASLDEAVSVVMLVGGSGEVLGMTGEGCAMIVMFG